MDARERKVRMLAGTGVDVEWVTVAALGGILSSLAMKISCQPVKVSTWAIL